LRVEVRTGDVAKVTPRPEQKLTPEQKARQAIDRWSRGVKANPDSARAATTSPGLT
jgi:hypothetical protein